MFHGKVNKAAKKRMKRILKELSFEFEVNIFCPKRNFSFL